jgi:hypothetical protein
VTGRPPAYVGVSGVVNPQQQSRLVAAASAAGFEEAGRELLLGVKGTHKTQYLDQENKYGPDWYPVGAAGFAGALASTTNRPAAQRVAQLYLELEHVADATYRTEFVERIVTRGNSWLTGLQFDMLPWHTDHRIGDFLRDVRYRYDLPIYLQAHGPAMKAFGADVIADALSDLTGVVDYILFDSSHGTGATMDVEQLGQFVEAAYSHPQLQRMGIAVAGGLDETSLSALSDLVSRYPDLSWDAEGKLHPGPADRPRPLAEETAADYLRTSAHLLRL